jgi:GT2 family glycosyltransferase
MSDMPVLSIIIPTHNRRDLLLKSLAALERQTWPAEKFEVIVVADACHDGTPEMVQAYARRARYELRLLAHQARSAAATRNLGATNARGQILLFLDDDVVAQPELVSSHMQAQHPDGVVLGYSKPMVPAKPSWWQYDARRWWEDTFREMRRPAHRFHYRDFFSGNVSMPAALFHKVAGFDSAISGRLEDYELGWRLLRGGARFRFVPEALGYHYDFTDLGRWLSRIRQEGIADIQIGQRHPELRAALFGQFDGPLGKWRRLMRTIAFTSPQVGTQMERLLLCQAVVCEKLRVRTLWQRTIGILREFNYWRGVSETIGGKRALASWLQEAPVVPAIAANAPTIDLDALPPPVLLNALLEQASHIGLRVTIDGSEVLALPPQIGAEPLREEHIQHILAMLAKRRFIPALAIRLSRSMGGAQA